MARFAVRSVSLVSISLFLCIGFGAFLSGCSDQGTELVEFDTLWNYSEPGSTEVKFRELLPAAEASGDDSYHLQLLTQISRTQGLQRNFEDAHATLDQVEAAMEDQPDVVKVRYMLERGRAYNSSKEVDKARPLFLEAWKLAKSSGEDFHAVDAAHMMGIIEEPEEALKWNEKAMAVAESSDDERAGKWLGSLYNNIGWTYHDQGEYEKALEVFEKALVWRQEKEQVVETRIAKWCVARALRSLERTDEALGMQEDLLAEFSEAGETDGYVFEELGECHLALGHTDEAKPYFAKAFEELSQDAWMVENESERLARLKSLGGLQ